MSPNWLLSQLAPLSRRSALRWGALGSLGFASLSPKSPLHAQQPSALPHRHCIFIFLFGGPSHIDLWDMKPAAPLEIRGDFKPIPTATPGIHLCEHLPRLAQNMDKFCLLRSMTHHMPVHGPACSEIYSGREYFGPPVTDQALPQDWPSLASLVHRFSRSKRPLPPSIVLPWYTQFVGQDKRIAGQSGGRMGEHFNPFLVDGNPNLDHFEVSGLSLLADVQPHRLSRRSDLVTQLDRLTHPRIPSTADVDRQSHDFRRAMQLIGEPQLADAFALHRESPALRQRYGRCRFGQSLLLARRLVEAGVSLVTVNWDDDHKDDKVSPHWDTHVENFPKLKNRLCPPFDQAFATFLADLHDRDLLDSTLVVALGEFGRTPKIGAITQNGMTERTGRDHWPHAFTTLLAGAGIRGGQVYGSTTDNGGYVKENPVSPADLAATILSFLGIDSAQQYDDNFLQVRQPLCIGRPIQGLAMN